MEARGIKLTLPKTDMWNMKMLRFSKKKVSSSSAINFSSTNCDSLPYFDVRLQLSDFKFFDLPSLKLTAKKHLENLD